MWPAVAFRSLPSGGPSPDPVPVRYGGERDRNPKKPQSQNNDAALIDQIDTSIAALPQQMSSTTVGPRPIS